ncbi:MAG TPA: response regulator transcription factor [Terriglobales bacterium]|nr:response regulator transcription factor [Terriglobales bacterium]
MAKIFAAESDLEVVAQTESLPQTLNAVAAIAADVILFETGLSSTPAEAVSEVARRAPQRAKLVLVAQRTGEEETVDYLRRGVQGILTRAISADLLVRCVRRVAAGETWLDKQSVNWVIQAYRAQALQGTAPRQQLRLSEKEMLIISGVTQGLKNKDIAREVGTTEQVVKNYLRKIYDKLQVADRLELALYSMNHRLLEGYVPEPRRPAHTAAGGQLPASTAPATTSAPAPPEPPKPDNGSIDG